MVQTSEQSERYQSRQQTNMWWLLAWNIGWLATAVLMKFGPQTLWNRARLYTTLAIGLNLCVGIGLVLVNKRYISDLDELQQKIYLNALAVTVGAALIVGVPYAVMDLYGMLPIHAHISHLLTLMGVTFIVSFLLDTWRYR